MSDSPRSTLAFAGLTAVAVLVVDQAVKVAVRGSLQPGEEREVLGSVVQLTYVRNTGIAFGQLSESGVLVALLVAGAVGLLLWYFLTHLETPWIWLPAGMVVGGALGNVIDRVGQGAVTDYVKLPGWPAFNVADACITGGVILMVVLAELQARRLRKAGAA
ncbi:MAG: signal peptidase II [Solirubrobacterales bacterium]